MSNQTLETGMATSMGTTELITKAEIDQQIATARRFPRSIRKFRDEATQMVTLTESIAGECIYSLPRDGRTIDGPSARFAEIIASAWGNCRAGARVVGEDDEFVTSQGVFHDLERNSSITFEVRRRIKDKSGRRFSLDMIGVTANAASSIALRNAVLKGVPKAFWTDMYDAAKSTVAGDVKTLVNRRAEMLTFMLKFGVTEEMILELFDVTGIEDLGQDELVKLRGIATALKEGETTVEQAFSTGKAAKERTEAEQAVIDAAKSKGKNQTEEDGETREPETQKWPKWIEEGNHWCDSDGTIFSAELNAWNREQNRPSVTDDGRFRKRRGTAKTEATQQPGSPMSFAQIADMLAKCGSDTDELDVIEDLMRSSNLPHDQVVELEAMISAKRGVNLPGTDPEKNVEFA